MTISSKTTIKTYFQTGDKPSQSQFVDMIDSYAQAPASNGFIAQVSAGDSQARTITGTSNEITVSNGTGAAGDPQISLPTAITLTGKTLTGGTLVSAVDANGAQIVGSLFKAGSTTHDVSVTGTQAVTGVGFRPKALLAFAAINLTSAASFGFSDGSTNLFLNDLTSFAQNTWQIGSTFSVVLTVTSSGQSTATLSSFDADGFTLTWNKTNLPTGTATINYLAFR